MNFESLLFKKRNSNNIAVIEREKEWTYKEFIYHAFLVRDYLLGNQVNKIMICLPQGFYAYSFIWGAYLAKVTFCPVTFSIPSDRKGYFISMFKPDLIISNENNLESTGNIKVKSAVEFFNIENFKLLEIENKKDDESLAYVIFTSGSTGKPKGVMVSRKSLNNSLKWSTKEYGINSKDRWGQFSNLGFDLSICDIFTAIICGAALVPISTTGEKLLPGKVIQNKKITFWHSVPSVIDIMNKAGHINSVVLSKVRTMTFCGERLFPSQLEMLFSANPALVIYNTYGPTECTIFCTYIMLTKDNYKQFCTNTVSIGNVIPGYEMRVNNLEDGLGEIVIIGDNIANGYLEESSASDSNINNGFRIINYNGKDKKAYYTGDFAEKIKDNIYFVCRKDLQIKIKGHRVDLSEIDFILREFGCKTNITTYHQNKIISFVVCDTVSEQTIREYLEKKLPAYYLPSAIILKHEFPYNSNGKIDINELINTL